MVLQSRLLDEQLIDAVKRRDIKEVGSLLDKAADPDAKRLSVLDKEANPGAISSSFSRYLINLVSDTFFCIPQYELALDGNNISALGYAINLAYTKIAKLLINKGASIDGYSHSAVQATHLNNAAKLGRVEIVELLLDRGADVNARDIVGNTPLHSTVRSFQYLGDGTEKVKKVINLLLDHGADINAQNNDGNTALCIAATHDRVGVTELLLDRGADVSVRGGDFPHDRHDMTALHYAASSIYNNAKTIELLLKYNLDINTQDSKGQTPISLGLKKQILPSDSTLKADVLFTFLVHSATLNEDDRSKINKNPNLQNCLTAFEKIKAMPHFGKLMESNKNKDTSYISQYIDDENEGQELAEEFHNIKKDYGFQVELSFIPESLLSFLECVISRYNDSAIRNLCYFVGLIKTGEHSIILPSLVSDQISLYLSDKDLNNLNLAYHNGITGNEYDDLKTEAYIEFKQKAYKEFKQDEKAANVLLDKLKGVDKKTDSLKKVSSSCELKLLHIAAINGNTEAVTALLDKGASPLIKNKDGKTPRDLANDENIIQLLKKAETKQITDQAIKTGVGLGVIAALTIGIGCGFVGAQLSILAIAGIVVAAALVTGIIASGITYLVLKPSNKLNEPDLEVANQRIPEKGC